MKALFFCMIFICISVTSASAFELMGNKTDLFDKENYHSYTGLASMEYYLLTPRNYDPKKTYPLVVTLHGASGHSYGAYALADPDRRKKYPAFVLVPVISGLTSWTLPIYTDIKDTPAENIRALIQRLEGKYSIDPKKVYLTGYSIGGIGTIEMAELYPDEFAAIAPLSGVTVNEDLKNIATLPIWVFQGQKDQGMPFEKARNFVNFSKQASGFNFWALFRWLR